jgi:predicted DNA-binding transcriptional regulator AlpA
VLAGYPAARPFGLAAKGVRVPQNSKPSARSKKRATRGEGTLPHRGPIVVFIPRGLRRDLAAEYVGVGTTFFDELVRDGHMPRPGKLGKRRIWDRHQLDAALQEIFDRDDNEWED